MGEQDESEGPQEKTLEDFLMELQDALLTGDQAFILETKKKYQEQVFLAKKKITDEADRKKEEKTIKANAQFLKQSQISRRQIMKDKELILEAHEKDLDEQQKKLQLRSQEEAKKQLQIQKQIEKERTKLASTHNQKILDVKEKTKGNIQQRQEDQFKILEQKRAEDNEMKKKEERVAYVKERERVQVEKERVKADNEQEKERKKQNAKIFKDEMKQLNEHQEKIREKQEESKRIQREIVKKRKEETEKTSQLIQQMDQSVEERKKQLEAEYEKKFEKIDRDLKEKDQIREEKIRKNAEKQRMIQWRAETEEELKRMKIQDKHRLDEYIQNELQEEKNNWLAVKQEESRLRMEAVIANKIEADKALVDKINGYIDKLEDEDNKTRKLFEQKSMKHSLYFQQENNKRERYLQNSTVNSSTIHPQRQVNPREQSYNEITPVEKEKPLSQSNINLQLVKHKKKQLEDEKRIALQLKLNEDQMRCESVMNNRAASAYHFRKNRLIRSSIQQQNLENSEASHQQKLSLISKSIRQKRDRAEGAEKFKSEVQEMKRQLIEKASLARTEEFRKLRQLIMKSRPQSAQQAFTKQL